MHSVQGGRMLPHSDNAFAANARRAHSRSRKGQEFVHALSLQSRVQREAGSELPKEGLRSRVVIQRNASGLHDVPVDSGQRVVPRHRQDGVRDGVDRLLWHAAVKEEKGDEGHSLVVLRAPGTRRQLLADGHQLRHDPLAKVVHLRHLIRLPLRRRQQRGPQELLVRVRHSRDRRPRPVPPRTLLGFVRLGVFASVRVCRVISIAGERVGGRVHQRNGRVGPREEDQQGLYVLHPQYRLPDDPKKVPAHLVSTQLVERPKGRPKAILEGGEDHAA
mmetsp:Transcript_10656/g.29911  ORF Transcript_10656/g.29911 Transcript_10656/m.29911 type:complete len:275 (-) Transcript_10656:649-1473(-)